MIPCGTLDIHGAPVEPSPSRRTKVSISVWKRTGESFSPVSTSEGSDTTKTPSAVATVSTTMAWTCVGAAAVSLLASAMPDSMPVQCQCRRLDSTRGSERPTLLTKGVAENVETLFWTCEGEEPCEALEKIDLGDRLDASIFLHGVCGIFALALHETFGYEIWAVAFEPEDWGDKEDTWENRLVHVYCQKGDCYVDVRGITDNEDAFFDEFADELYGDDEYIEVPATDLRDWIFESMSSEEYTFFHNAAMDLIQKHYAEYQV